MSVKITFVIGGARSGKSSFVLDEVSKLEGTRAYIATGEALDDEMQDRIRKHKEDRGPEWTTYEEPVEIVNILSDIKDKYSAVVIDCLTLWLSNIMLQHQDTTVQVNSLLQTLESLNSSNSSNGLNLYIVSNELGMGIVPENAMAREFRDLTGFLNQKVAAIADEVYLVTAGIPMKIK